MDAKSIEGAQSLAESAREYMPALIEKIRYRIKPIDLGRCYSLLSGYHRRLGMYDYLVEGKIRSLKQHFYVASKLCLASIREDEYQQFETGGDIFDALLSDSPEVINAMAHLETPTLIRERDNPLWSRFHVHMLQLAIRGEDAALREKIEKIAKHGKKPERQASASGQDFYSLLLQRDQAGLENLIQNKSARIKSADPLIEDWMSYLGTLQTKLCWLKGIPVQIDSPLIPMELMPIQPLAHYDGVYDFLQPGWVPPSQGIVGRVSRWLKR